MYTNLANDNPEEVVRNFDYLKKQGLEVALSKKSKKLLKMLTALSILGNLCGLTEHLQKIKQPRP